MFYRLPLQLTGLILVSVSCCMISYKIYIFSCSNSQRKCADLSFENCGNNCCSSKTKERIVVCYFTNWAWYRSGIGKFTPQNINTSLCTHINYAFAFLNGENFTIDPFDPWADIDNHFYESVTNLTAEGLEVLISIGGWTNSDASAGWSRMFNSPTNRATFIKSVLKFMKQYHFSGLDIDFEYPACPQGNRSAGSPVDAENFNKLVRELKEEFNGEYKLSVTVPAGKSNLQECFNIHELCRIPDWINVMAYEYHSWREHTVGANAPICGSGQDWGVYESLQYLTIDANCPSSQLVLGIPFYAQSYTLDDESKPEFGEKASGPGNEGLYTKEKGNLAYYEVCQNQESGWSTGWNTANGSYIWNNSQFASFDNIIDIKRKSCLINRYFDLKGAMIWALDYDDFTDSCGRGVNSLLTTLNQQLRCPHSTHKAG